MKKYLSIMLLLATYEVLCTQPKQEETSVSQEETQTSTSMPGTQEYATLEEVDSLVAGRISEVEVSYLDFKGNTQIMTVKVLDVVADSVREIFRELLELRFPIYMIWGYDHRSIAGTERPSIHAFGLAIDVNEHLNPSYKAVVSGVVDSTRDSDISGDEDNVRINSSKRVVGIIDPLRDSDRSKDADVVRRRLKSLELGLSEDQISIAVDVICSQEKGSDDWYINSRRLRPGMTDEVIAEIFGKHGFIEWGGLWRDPIDPMHFQCFSTRKEAEEFLRCSKEEAMVKWKAHLEECKKELEDRRNEKNGNLLQRLAR